MKQSNLLKCEKCGKKFKEYFENKENNLCPDCWLHQSKIESKKEVKNV